MSKFLTTITEIYRADSEFEAERIISEAKEDNRFTLHKYNCEAKERKQKGAVIDSYFKVTLTKIFNDEKEPQSNVDVIYEVH